MLRCVQDVTVDDAVLREGVLRIVFDREQCRRKLIPLFLKRLWWKFEEFLRSREQHPRRNKRELHNTDRLASAEGPVGFWIASHDMMTIYGMVHRVPRQILDRHSVVVGHR